MKSVPLQKKELSPEGENPSKEAKNNDERWDASQEKRREEEKDESKFRDSRERGEGRTRPPRRTPDAGDVGFLRRIALVGLSENNLTNEETQKLIEAFRDEVDDAEKVEKFEGLIRLQAKRSERKPSKLCRLRYSGDINSWEFEIYKYSDNWYDTEGEFPFAGGTVEECFDAAASLYITQTFP